jgi:CheY-like chemotaxis protein
MERPKILMVDDEPDITRYVKLGLERTSAYEVRTLNDPESTIEAALQFRPNLIILDVLMPGMDGGMVAAALGQDPELKGIPIIFMTAVVSGTDPKVVGEPSGGRSYLPKPIELSALLQRIESIVGKRAPY